MSFPDSGTPLFNHSTDSSMPKFPELKTKIYEYRELKKREWVQRNLFYKLQNKEMKVEEDNSLELQELGLGWCSRDFVV